MCVCVCYILTGEAFSDTCTESRKATAMCANSVALKICDMSLNHEEKP